MVSAALSYATEEPPRTGSTDSPVFRNGAKSLFIGHSFFIPEANSFDRIAKQSGFSSHQVDVVFASGPKGAPGALWNSSRHKEKVESKLSSGEIELFGLTAFGPMKSSLEDYRRWFDLALQYNPRTRFFIGNPFPPLGPRMDTSKYDEKAESSGDVLYATVSELRALYPDNDIYFINYGKTASVMKREFEAGALEDITKLYSERKLNKKERRGGMRGRRTNSKGTTGEGLRGGGQKDVLFLDRAMGHAGPMMQDLSALLWLHFLYGTKIDQLSYSEDYDKFDVQRIAEEVISFNRGRYLVH
jgi:hypothetical protein